MRAHTSTRKRGLQLLQYVQNIPFISIRHRLLDRLLNIVIPFNKGLGFRIQVLSTEQAQVLSPPKRRRQNHVQGAHACALALLGEYTAGLLLAQSFSPAEYRIIIGKLEVEYLKQGRGNLMGTAHRDKNDISSQNQQSHSQHDVTQDVRWANMITIIRNEKNEDVAVVRTHWQIKKWETLT